LTLFDIFRSAIFHVFVVFLKKQIHASEIKLSIQHVKPTSDDSDCRLAMPLANGMPIALYPQHQADCYANPTNGQKRRI